MMVLKSVELCHDQERLGLQQLPKQGRGPEAFCEAFGAMHGATARTLQPESLSNTT